MRNGAAFAWVFILVATACATACGSDEALPPEIAPATSMPQIGEENREPQLRSIEFDPNAPASGDQLQVMVSASDPDGDPVELSYRWWIDGDLAGGDEPTLDLTEVSPGAEIELLVTAHDAAGARAESRAAVEVINRPPSVTRISVEPSGQVAPGAPLVASAEGSDGDGDAVTFEYEWSVNGRPTAVRGNVFKTGELKQGDEIRVTVFASDGSSRGRGVESAAVRVLSAHPEIVSMPPVLRSDGVFAYAVKAHDPDGDRRLRYRLDSAPEGMRIDEVLGEVTWRPERTQTGVHEVAVVVLDSTGLETTQRFQVSVNEGEPPAAKAGTP